ncbi:MAG: hypothetical protein AMS24_00675 [Chlamydiae bacterium SM23_39]|nr:MAG: hypothetical protein AMS24_00675 [Chlamydiae bacterium SM23_39]
MNIFLNNLNKEMIITKSFSPDFLEIKEKDLTMDSLVKIDSRVYITNGYLIIDLTAKTEYKMHCSICNKLTSQPLEAKILLNIPTKKIDNSIYSYKNDLRNALLLNIPNFVECEKNCPNRKHIKKFLKKEEKASYPFKILKKGGKNGST